MQNHDDRRDWLVILLTVATAAAALWTGAGSVHAHDWYPLECCHSTDCAPVDSVGQFVATAGGVPQLVVTSKHGTAIVPQNLPRRPSMDNRMHVCMRSLNGAMYVLCLFVPPSM
jgi:hypothetical protein